MIRDTTTNQHSVLRMVPPKEIRYFFTFGDHHIRIAKDQPVCTNYMKEEDYNIHNDVHINIPKLNFYENIHPAKSLITEDFLSKMAVKPRPDEKHAPVRIRPKTPWDFNKSIFAAYKQDNEDLLNKCFEADWESSRIPKIAKDDNIDEIKELLKSKYRKIRE